VLVAEENLKAGYGHYVIVEGASLNGFPALLQMQDTGWREAMAARDGFTGL
jgi:hypothetical protein